jgi:hypothetical protein
MYAINAGLIAVTHASELAAPLLPLPLRQAGLMPRMLEYLFQQLQQQTAADAGVAWLVRCSMLEIYCEEIQDLLVTGSGKLQLREDTRLGVHVAGLSDRPVTSGEPVGQPPAECMIRSPSCR